MHGPNRDVASPAGFFLCHIDNAQGERRIVPKGELMRRDFSRGIWLAPFAGTARKDLEIQASMYVRQRGFALM